MPILPLNAPEPFAATLGVMLYPGLDESDQAKARAFAAQWLAEPLRRFHEAGHHLSYETLSSIAQDTGTQLTDVDERWCGGAATGELFKALYLLAQDYAPLASWENAIRIYEIYATRTEASGSRSQLYECLKSFRTVAHLWGAWSFREGRFDRRAGTGYDGYDDFHCFLAEAEILRDFGQVWRPTRASASPPLPKDVWRVPDGWKAPVRRAGWPNTGVIPHCKLAPDVTAKLRPPGRPRKSA
jgi:hypothetical protein